MSEKLHELAPHHLPYFIPLADGSDPMMRNVLIALIILVILLGTFYLYLHSLPERLAHKHGRIQFELVAVLGLLALFTHNQIFWVAALVLAFIQLPDFMAPLESIARSARQIAGGKHGEEGQSEEPLATTPPADHGSSKSTTEPPITSEARPITPDALPSADVAEAFEQSLKRKDD